jgi:hypothetical protein
MLLKELRKQYGRLAGIQSDYSCLGNSLHNSSLAIYGGLYCHILFVMVPVENHILSHAYLSDGRRAYTKGLTSDHFPELSLKQINMLKGRDVTNIMFWQALQITHDSKYNYHRVLEKLEENIPGITTAISNCFNI